MRRFRIDFNALWGSINPKTAFRETVSTFRRLYKTDPNVVVFVLYGLLYDAVMNLFKPFALKFLDRVGGTEFHISLYNALPGLAAVAAIIPGSIFINRFRRKKRVTTVFFAFSRAFVLMMAFVPFVPTVMQPLLFVVLVSSMNFFDAIGQNAFQGLLGSAFNGVTRARAISLRNKFGNIFIMVVTLITGLIISFVPKTDAQRVLIYQIFFVASFALSLVEIFVFTRFRETETEVERAVETTAIESENVKKESPLKIIASTMKDKNFKKFLIPSLFFYFTWHMGWPLGGVVQVKTLGANELWLAILAVTSGLAAATFASRWNRLINKRGNQIALVWGAVGVGVNMFGYALSFNLPTVAFVNAFGGGVSIGVTIALFNGLLIATPDKDRVVYIGVYNTFANVSLAVSPFVSLWITQTLGIRPALWIVGTCRIIAAGVIYLTYNKSKSSPTLDTP